jgi:hypothetical protein
MAFNSRTTGHVYRQRQISAPEESGATEQNTEAVWTDQATAGWQYWVAQGYLF